MDWRENDGQKVRTSCVERIRGGEEELCAELSRVKECSVLCSLIELEKTTKAAATGKTTTTTVLSQRTLGRQYICCVVVVVGVFWYSFESDTGQG